jgi:SPP1 gp7 family putative phage head morphogenesis protein
MDELTEAELSHEIYLNKLSSFYANKWEDIEPLIIKAIRQAFSEFDDISTKAEANALNDRIDELLSPILEEAVSEQEQATLELAEQEIEFQNRLFEAAELGALAGALSTLVDRAIRNYRNSLVLVGIQGSAEDTVKKFNNYPKATVDQIKNFVLGGYTEGQDITQTRVSITGTNKNKFKDGYTATAKRNFQSYVRTTRKAMESQSKTVAFKAAGTDGYVLSAVLDSRTSDICLGWNGTVILWTESYQPKPPFHFNCRTTIIPYFTGGTEIPAGGFDWLKRQSAQFQNELIGPTRGDLLRNSGLTADEYRKASRNNLNEPITLEEMARKNKEIADRLKQTQTGV